MNDVFVELAAEYENVRFLKVRLQVYGSSFYHCCMTHVQVEAESLPEVSLKYDIVAVPTVIFIKVYTHPKVTTQPSLVLPTF